MKTIIVSSMIFLLTVLTGSFADEPKSNTQATSVAQLAIDQSEWPKEVALIGKVSFPIVIDGQERGEAGVPPGMKLKLVKIQGEFVELTYGGVTQFVPAEDTDLITRVIAARKARAQFIQDRMKAVAQDSAPAPVQNQSHDLSVETEHTGRKPHVNKFTSVSDTERMGRKSHVNKFISVSDFTPQRKQLLGQRVTVSGVVSEAAIGMHSEGDWYMLDGKLECRFRIGSHCTEGSSKETRRSVSITGTVSGDHLGIPRLVDCDCPD